MSTPWVCKPKRDILQRPRHTCSEPGCDNRVGDEGRYCPAHKVACVGCGERIAKNRRGVSRCKTCAGLYRRGRFEGAEAVIADYERAIERGWEPKFCKKRIKAIRETYLDTPRPIRA